MNKIKKIIIAFALIASILAPSIVLNSDVAVQAATIKLNRKSITLVEGKTATLKVTGTKTKATWKSSDAKIATVSTKGVVKAIAAGSTKVTATVGKTNLTCSVTVKKAAVKDKTTEFEGLTFTYPGDYEVTTKDIPGDGQMEHFAYFALASDPDKYVGRIKVSKGTFTWGTAKPFIKTIFNEKFIIPAHMSVYNQSGVTPSDIKKLDYKASFLEDALQITYNYKSNETSGKGEILVGMIGDKLIQMDVADVHTDGMKVMEKIFNSAKK